MNKFMSVKPTVAYILRDYLSPTETFIGNQISALQSFKPIVLCHNQNGNKDFPIKDIFCTTDILNGFHKVRTNLSYRLFKHLTKEEIEILLEIIDVEKVRLIHFHYTVDARFFLNLEMTVNVPSIVSCYGYDITSFPRIYWGYGKIYLKPIFKEIDIFLAMSEDMKKDLIKIGCPEEKILIHYYGIDTERFAYPERQYQDKESVNILMCGTLETKKAQHLVLKALRKLELRHVLNNEFIITIVGDGPMEKYLKKLVQEFEWQDKVNFTGHIPFKDNRLAMEFRKADIFTLPSITTVKGEKEGIPGTIVEAMASGLPIVSTYHAGIPEVIESEKQGILVKERDIDGLVRVFKRLIDDSSQREQFGKAAAEKAINEFDMRKRITNLERIYNSMI